MPTSAANPLLDPFLASAEAVALERPEVDVELAGELLTEAATMLHDGLALDGLDEHDAEAVIAGLSTALVAVDPTAAGHERSRAAREEPWDLHDPDAVSASYLIAASILRL